MMQNSTMKSNKSKAVDENRREFVINLDEMPMLHEIFKDSIKKFGKKYKQYVMSNQIVQEDYRKLLNGMLFLDNKIRSGKEKDDNGKIIRYYWDEPNQFGGSDSQSKSLSKLKGKCAGIGVDNVSDITAILLYYHREGKFLTEDGEKMGVDPQEGGFLIPGIPGIGNPISLVKGFLGKSDEVCPPLGSVDFPIYPRDKGVPNPLQILQTILPESIIAEMTAKGTSTAEFIKNTTAFLDIFSQALSVLDETSGSNLAKVGKSTLKVGISTALSIISSGAGGDNAASLPGMLAKGANLITKLFSKLGKIMVKLQSLITALRNGLDVAVPVLDRTGQLVSAGVNTLDPNFRDEKIREVENQLFFLMDIFSIDFREGPVGVRCWTEYIISGHLQSSENVTDIKGILCLMNDIYKTINEILLGFIGSTLDAIIPNTLGLGGVLTPFLSGFSDKIYSVGRSQAELMWKTRVPEEIRLSIQDPEKLKFLMWTMLSQKTLGLGDWILKTVGNQIESVTGINPVEYTVDLTAKAINKGLSFMFIFINLFSIFADLNTFSSKKYTDIDTAKLFKDECPNIIAKGAEFAEKVAPKFAELTDVKNKQEFGEKLIDLSQTSFDKLKDTGRKTLEKEKEQVLKKAQQRREDREREAFIAQQKLSQQNVTDNNFTDFSTFSASSTPAQIPKIPLQIPSQMPSQMPSQNPLDIASATTNNFSIMPSDMSNLYDGSKSIPNMTNEKPKQIGFQFNKPRDTGYVEPKGFLGVPGLSIDKLLPVAEPIVGAVFKDVTKKYKLDKIVGELGIDPKEAGTFVKSLYNVAKASQIPNDKGEIDAAAMEQLLDRFIQDKMKEKTNAQ